MPNTRILIGAIGLLVVGAIGLGVTFGAAGSYPSTGSGTPTPSLGRVIYYTGADTNGPVPRTIAGGGLTGLGMMNTGSCVDCHGQDGRGGRIATMMGVVDIPDIRYSFLTTPHSDAGTSTPAWTDADIGRAIRDGVDPSGQPLTAPMPRWAMSDADITAVIAYLKELK